MSQKTNHPLVSACAILGSQASLARALGVKPPTVNQWINCIRPVPIEQAIEIEHLTDARVTCEQLLPSVNWHVIRGQSINPTEADHAPA